jgi:UDP-glucose 4-epimerase
VKILVTGSDGFIGKYVLREAANRGHEVFGYDITKGNSILARDNLIGKAEDREVDAIIHLAGLLGTHELWDQREAAIDVNIKGALNVADAAMEVDAKLVSIEQPHIWYNVYEATKYAARRMLTGLFYDQDLRVEFVTAHNAFGPWQHYGDGHPQKILPTFATLAWEGRDIPVWGDGNQRVNLVYAGDVAKMLVDRAEEYGADPIRIYNAGSQRLMTVKNVASYVRDYTGQGSKIVHERMRRGEQWFPYPEPDESYPFQTRFEDLDKTIDWYKP